MLATKLFTTENRKRTGMEKEQEREHNKFLPKKGNTLNETVIYQIGGTIYEVSTICCGSELLYNKM